ncbi:uncharacterized protein LOC117788513 [Drosophila innubila]|uniref:uncharacterized protein LOC117788513 n=1 Tax=Drosophila innubila TaxID=198719 RepID=UPI00148CB042|nr:uncharacterized protein LOC117788513 [Drosophila innubila]
MEYMVAPPYGKQVLIGNWLDRRYAFDEKGNGILPGLNPPQECEQHRSLSQDTYTMDVYEGDKCKRDFVEKRVTRMRNFSTSTSSSVKLLDNPAMKNNFTTTNTLLYDWMPKMFLDHYLKQKLPSAGRPQLPHKPDMLQCFGNLTKTRNFAEQLQNEKALENLHHMQTTYDIAYNLSGKLTHNFPAL